MIELFASLNGHINLEVILCRSLTVIRDSVTL